MNILSDKFINKYGFKTLWLFIGAYIILFFVLSLKKYQLFAYNGLDLVIFNQAFQNILKFDWLAPTVNLNTYLADHFTPIALLLAPLYAIWPKPQMLLFLQSVIIGLSAWPLYKISFTLNKSTKTALLVSLLWLFNPIVHNANLFEFHLVPFAIFFIFWTFYFYRQNRFWPFAIFFILSVLVREDIALLLLGLVPLSFLDKKTIKWKMFSFIFPLVYFFIALSIVGHFNPGGSYKFLIYYGWLGGDSPLAIIWSYLSHPTSVFWHIFSFTNIFGVAFLLFLFLFLPIIKPKYFWLGAVPFFQFVLSGSGLSPSVYYTHYGLLLMPALFIAIIFALDKIKNRQAFFASQYVYQNLGFAKLALLVGTLYFFIFLSPIKDLLIYDSNTTQQVKAQEFISQIPPGSSLVAELNFLPQLSNDYEIYPMHYAYLGHGQFSREVFEMPVVDYILADYHEFVVDYADIRTSIIKQQYSAGLPSRWRKILDDYVLIKADNNFFLWQNKTHTNQAGLSLYTIKDKPDSLSSDEFLFEIELSSGDYRKLVLTFQKIHDDERDRLIRFYTDEGYFDMILDYGIYPEREWSDDKLVSFYYYPGPEVHSFQIFDWRGRNKVMGPLRQVVADLKLQEETDKIDL